MTGNLEGHGLSREPSVSVRNVKKICTGRCMKCLLRLQPRPLRPVASHTSLCTTAHWILKLTHCVLCTEKIS